MLVATIGRDAVDWLALVFTAGGVGIAIWQSIRSGRIANSARRAVERAELQLTGNQLIGMAATLEALETELLRVSHADDRDSAPAVIVRWRQVAGELIGMIEHRPDVNADVLAGLKRVTSQATAAQAELSDKSKGVRIATKQLRLDIAETLSHLSRWAGALKASTQGDGSGR